MELEYTVNNIEVHKKPAAENTNELRKYFSASGYSFQKHSGYFLNTI